MAQTSPIAVDEAACAGYGTCVLIAPELFELEAADGPVALREVSDPDPARLEEAVASCPTQALTLNRHR